MKFSFDFEEKIDKIVEVQNIGIKGVKIIESCFKDDVDVKILHQWYKVCERIIEIYSKKLKEMCKDDEFLSELSFDYIERMKYWLEKLRRIINEKAV